MKKLTIPNRLIQIMTKVADTNNSINLDFVKSKTFKMAADELLVAKIENKLEERK